MPRLSPPQTTLHPRAPTERAEFSLRTLLAVVGATAVVVATTGITYVVAVRTSAGRDRAPWSEGSRRTAEHAQDTGETAVDPEEEPRLGALKDAIARNDPAPRIVTLVERLSAVASRRSAGTLKALLDSPAGEVRHVAAAAFAKVAGDDALPALQTRIGARQSADRASSWIEAIGAIRTPRAIQALETYASGSDGRLVAIAVEILARTPGTDASEALVRMASRRTSLHFHRVLTALLSRSDGPAYARTLTTESDDDRSNALILAGLAEHGDEEAFLTLRARAVETDPRAQASIDALGTMDSARATAALMSVVDRVDGPLARAAVSALAAQGNERSIASLLQVIERRRDLIQHALRSLAEIHTPGGQSAFIDQLESRVLDRALFASSVAEPTPAHDAIHLRWLDADEGRRDAAEDYFARSGSPAGRDRMLRNIAATSHGLEFDASIRWAREQEGRHIASALLERLAGLNGLRREAVLDVLSRIAPSQPAVIALFADMVRSGANPSDGDLSRAAAVRLNDEGSVRMFETLATAAASDDARRTAISALADSTLPSARAALERLTRNDPELHAQHFPFDASALTTGERQRKLDDLLRGTAVASSMREIGELLTHDSTLARASLNHPNEQVRRSALASRALSHTPDYPSLLRAGLDDDSETVREIALSQLGGALTAREMIEELEDQLQNDRASLTSKLQIIESLFYSYGTEGRERLTRLRENGEVPQALEDKIEEVERVEAEGYDEGC